MKKLTFRGDGRLTHVDDVPVSDPRAELRAALTLLTNFAARQVRLHDLGHPLEGNVTDKENEFMNLIDFYTQERERAARIDELENISFDEEDGMIVTTASDLRGTILLDERLAELTDQETDESNR